MEKKVVILDGLTCSNCAGKIEKDVKLISTIDSAFIDFANSKLIFENAKELSKENFDKIKEIVNKYEPDVNVFFEGNKKKDDENKGNVVLKKEKLRLIISTIVFVVSLLYLYLVKAPSEIVELVLFLSAYIISGQNVILKALRNIRRGKVFDENFLMLVATLGAFFIKQYPEGVAVMIFYNYGEYFQKLAVNNSRKSISSLMNIKPEYANLITSKGPKKVDPSEVKLGQLIIVKPGEKIPIDGLVVSGNSMLDTSSITGESVPRSIGMGEEIVSGSINLNSVITIKTSKLYADSTVSKIIELVENAAKNKAPTEEFISKFAAFYTPIIVVSALLLAILPPILLGTMDFNEWIYRALVFLVISCPCALVVSVPLGYFGGIGVASKNGVLVKGGNYLDALNSIDVVIFDKTGTLTKGVFKVVNVDILIEMEREEFLRLVSHTEAYSNHPIAKSIIDSYGHKIDHAIIEEHNEIHGKGIKAKIEGKEILVGNEKLLESNNIAFEKNNEIGTVIYVAIDGKYCGSLIISDEIKEDSKTTIETLKKIGIKKTVMLTGDNENIAKKVASELEIDEVYFELLPDEKVERVKEIKDKFSNKVIFVGDGTNDAPVLALSDVGVAMGAFGSDAAIEAADVVLMTDEVSKLVEGINVAKRTRKIVIENIVFALGVKGVFLLLGAFGMATLWEAVFADVGVTVIAVLNTIRILKK